jgi:hypothetical protein
MVFLDHFDVLMLNINFKKLKKYYFDTFLNKKHFEKAITPLYQTGSKCKSRDNQG